MYEIKPFYIIRIVRSIITKTKPIKLLQLVNNFPSAVFNRLEIEDRGSS